METEVKTNVGMGCYEHPERTVVATCSKCGKFMCKECAEKYESKLCEACEKERVAKEEAKLKNASDKYHSATKKKLTGVIVKSVILAVIGFLIGGSSNAGMGFVCAYVFAAFPWGWNFIKQIIDSGVETWAFLASDTLWFVTVLIKFALAVIIGCVYFPIGVFKAVKNFLDAKKIKENVDKK